MKADKKALDNLKQNFLAIKSKNDIVDVLNDANKMIYDKKVRKITLKSLNYYANPKLSINRYTTFQIKKKSGANRTINAPVKELKFILRALNFILHHIAKPHQAATGFIKGKSVIDNAKEHKGQNYVLNVDLKDFFHAFERKHVKYGFMKHPFYIGGDREQLSFMLASLCTHPLEIDGKYKNVLPQGSPTSPIITNILCEKLDRRLKGLANRFGAKYTRYADDITFSSSHYIYQKDDHPVLNSKGCYDNFIAELNRIVNQLEFDFNPDKTRLQKNGYRQEVTGVVVNEKVNVKKRYVKQLRQWLHLWEKWGYEIASEKFKNDYLSEKGHVKSEDNKMLNVIDGKLEYLKMVKGGKDSTYLKLKSRFDKLKAKESQVNKILHIWETEGIDKAMKVYYSSNRKQSKNVVFTLN